MKLWLILSLIICFIGCVMGVLGMGEPSDWKSQTANNITTDREKNNYSLKQRIYFFIGAIVCVLLMMAILVISFKQNINKKKGTRVLVFTKTEYGLRTS
ncbi:hypothetical protein HMPREF9425_1789 [Streptococcus vestibularis ATCC 49124]|jgi:hypothetical protein|uniref:Uncharacterized protein n=2 Tax=Streptococcus TaxID=1301 RepID=A0ABN0CET7_STRVE|nr:hypothetical protein HMPREF9425_1789 [Streptococcus vestibularis ATCC 49124]